MQCCENTLFHAVIYKLGLINKLIRTYNFITAKITTSFNIVIFMQYKKRKESYRNLYHPKIKRFKVLVILFKNVNDVSRINEISKPILKCLLIFKLESCYFIG